MMELAKGDWVVFDDASFGGPKYITRQIDRVTPKLVKLKGSQWPRQKPKGEILCAFEKEGTAQGLCQSLNGVAGDYAAATERLRAEHKERATALREKLDTAVARQVAKARGEA